MTAFGPFELWEELWKYPLFTLEAEFFFIFLAIVLIHRRLASGFMARCAAFDEAGKTWHTRSVFLVAVVALLAHAAALPVLRRPLPGIHDEFSYLLAADTFASGRLANPPHQLWPHFESFHINMRPTYASMYPPAQGLALAAGQLLGDPIIGVWIATALFCASLCWMLQAWMPGSWALIGGIICALRLGVFSYWANTFWGGSVAATGGCLIWGAVGRLRQEPRTGPALWLALGLLIVANSRPYEGAWMAIPTALALSPIVFGRTWPMKISLRRFVLPLSLALTAGCIFMAYYHWRVFGSIFTLPYLTNRETYAVAPNFIWQTFSKVPPRYNHAAMQQFYTVLEPTAFKESRTWEGLLRLTRLKLYSMWLFFLGPALTVPLVAFAIAVLRRRWAIGWPTLGLISVLVGLLLLSWSTSPHYLAPAACCLYFAVLQGLRVLCEWRSGTRFSGTLALASVLACCAVVPVRATLKWLGGQDVNNIFPMPWHAAELFPLESRERISRGLTRIGGKHLIVVRYGPKHSPHTEYVYNKADIDQSDIIWARELENPLANVPLMNYYRDRSIWLLRPDESESLVPHPLSRSQSLRH